uniref:Putative lipocalin-2 1 n=1 Tax=Amblyomma cajennense TaxID=34607 RepID=A0A023FS86_AMBCJ
MRKSRSCTTMGRWRALWIAAHVAICCHVGYGNHITDNGENIDIKKAVNTNQTLWLLEQTYKNSFTLCSENFCIKENETCIRNKMVNISDTEYYFNQTVRVENDDATLYLGKFVETNPLKSMEVTDTTGPADPELWTLQYQDPENGPCMVFSIEPLDPELRKSFGTCEMYFRGRPTSSDPSQSCKNFFTQRCNSTAVYKPYRDTCSDDPTLADSTASNDIPGN